MRKSRVLDLIILLGIGFAIVGGLGMLGWALLDALHFWGY